MSQSTYYTVLPHQVRLDHRLCPFARLLYGEIVALSHQTGYCWASNAFFAQLYQVKEKAVGRWLRELRQASYIRVEVAKGNQRKIYPVNLLKATDQNAPSGAPLAGGTPTISEVVPDTREGGSAPKGEAVTALLLSNKINNKTEYRKSMPLFLVPDNWEEGLPEKSVQNIPHVSPMDGVHPPDPPVAPAPLSPPKKDAPPKFAKPSIGEVEDYMLGQSELCPNTLTARAQALRFVNYYESNGWKVGRNAMKDWQAAANNWLLNAQTYQSTKPPSRDRRLHSGGVKDYSIPL